MGWKDTGYKFHTLFAGNCPAAPGTQLPLSTKLGDGLLVGISQFVVAVVDMKLIGPTGGTLDVYLQSSLDADQAGNGSWYDVAHLPQVTAATTFRYAFAISRGFNRVAATATALNNADNTPSLAANTIIADALGNALRVVLVANAGVSVAAAQSIKLGLSQ